MERQEQLEEAGKILAKRFSISADIAMSIARDACQDDIVRTTAMLTILGVYTTKFLAALGASENPGITEDEIREASKPFVRADRDALRKEGPRWVPGTR